MRRLLFCVGAFVLSVFFPMFSVSQTVVSVGNQVINENKEFSVTNPAAAAGGGSVVVGSPSSFSQGHLYNSPWNFTPPHLLFHPSKTINDHSAFHRCRLVNLSTQIRDSFKDKILGIFDEKEFISTGVGKLKGSAPVRPNHIVVCGLQTAISPKCVQYIGTGYILLEEYSSTEAALVGISQIASKKGANLIGNLNCPYAETVRSRNIGAGGSVGDLGNSSFGSLGGVAAQNRSLRTVQPHCNGDFYLVTKACKVSNDNYMPQPRPYRRYLPNRAMTQPQAAPMHSGQQQVVRGYY